MKIVYKHQAVLDIRQTQEYIAETLGNKGAAQKLVASILKAISLLEENPMMGVSMKAKFEIKIIAFHQQAYIAFCLTQYLLSAVYSCCPQIRVLDGRQDYLAILFG